MRAGDYVYMYFAKGILIFFPNLESLNLKNLVATTATINIETYLMAYVLSVIYTSVVLFFAAWAFERKSFDTV